MTPAPPRYCLDALAAALPTSCKATTPQRTRRGSALLAAKASPAAETATASRRHRTPGPRTHTTRHSCYHAPCGGEMVVQELLQRRRTAGGAGSGECSARAVLLRSSRRHPLAQQPRCQRPHHRRVGMLGALQHGHGGLRRASCHVVSGGTVQRCNTRKQACVPPRSVGWRQGCGRKRATPQHA